MIDQDPEIVICMENLRSMNDVADVTIRACDCLSKSMAQYGLKLECEVVERNEKLEPYKMRIRITKP